MTGASRRESPSFISLPYVRLCQFFPPLFVLGCSDGLPRPGPPPSPASEPRCCTPRPRAGSGASLTASTTRSRPPTPPRWTWTSSETGPAERPDLPSCPLTYQVWSTRSGAAPLAAAVLSFVEAEARVPERLDLGCVEVIGRQSLPIVQKDLL